MIRLPQGAPEEFMVPSERSVRSVLAGAMDAVGLETPGSHEHREILGLERAERVCVVLVDGLGANNLASRSGHAPNLRSFTHAEPLTSVAPSTTAAAITSVGTAMAPGETAMMGYSLRSPRTGAPFSLIKWEEEGLDPLTWQTQPTLFERLGERASECSVIQPSAFVGSGLTLAALRGTQTLVAETLEERVNAAASAMRQGTRCVYLYWGDVDHTGHNKGWTSDEWVAELEHLDQAMGMLARSLPKGTLVVVTADHGMVDVEERIDVFERPGLLQGVDLMAGEDRAIQLYTSEPEQVAQRWREELGDLSMVLTKDEAIATGLFGQTTDFSRQVMGDVFAFQTGRATILDSRYRRPGAMMRGVHGSLTADEMLVPFIVEIV